MGNLSASRPALRQILLAVTGVLLALVTLYYGLYWLGGGGGWTTLRLLGLIALTAIVVRLWPQAWRDRFTAVVWCTLIGGFLARMFTGAILQREHHPVKLPMVGWLGNRQAPEDPGDCDPSVSSCP